MRWTRRAAAVLAASGAIVLATSVNAWAFTTTYGYTLSGNGRMEYSASTNQIKGIDYKDGDYIYIQYGWTNDVCNSSGDACAPGSVSTFRLAHSNKDYSQTIGVGQNGTYILLKICNDDAPPDTCSKWKRTGA